MWECYCCGRLFARPRSGGEARGECFGFPATESGPGCPYCGGGYGLYPARAKNENRGAKA